MTTPFREGNNILVSVGIGNLSATDDIPDDIAGPFIIFRLRPSLAHDIAVAVAVALNVSLAGCRGAPIGGKSGRRFSYLFNFLRSREQESNVAGVG